MTSEFCIMCCEHLRAIEMKQCDSPNSVQMTNVSIFETWLFNKQFTLHKSVLQVKPRLLVQRAVKNTKDNQDGLGGDIGGRVRGGLLGWGAAIVHSVAN